MSSLQQEYNEGGQLADKSYDALEKAGIPKDYVDAFIKGQEAIAQQTSNTLKQEVGGADAYNNMMSWASDNLSEAEVKEMIEGLPFFPLSKSIEYFNLIKQF